MSGVCWMFFLCILVICITVTIISYFHLYRDTLREKDWIVDRVIKELKMRKFNDE